MKYKKKVTLLIILIILVSLCYILINSNIRLNSQNNYIFFKFFSSNNTNNENKVLISDKTNNVYNFKIKDNYLESQEIKLYKTMDEKTLINEKIAPGVKGSFIINLFSNINLNYQIKFKSLNEKPHNLAFYLKNSKQKFTNLEQLETELNDNISKKENRKIEIFWEWEYDVNIEKDLIDTNDAKNIEKYNFEIYIITQ